MSVYKRTVRGKRSRNYSFDYVDENGRQRTVSSGTSDKRLAERIKGKHVDRVRAIHEGLVDVSLERFRDESEKPLGQHVGDYLLACEGRGEASSGLNEKRRHLAWFLKVIPGATLSTIRSDAFDLRLSGLTREGKSARTANMKLECANAFLNWAVRNGRLTSNPLRVVPRRNQTTDRRRVRRILTADESTRLIAVARGQAARVTGARSRPLWYFFPLLAGLRKGDMERLKWGDLDLDATPPTITIRGGKARKRVDVLPIHPELLAELRAYRPNTVLPSAPVFEHSVSNATRQRGFVRAGIELETDGKYADLHSLRHSFGTRLAEAGVPPAKLQRLMRHATVELTMRFYVHLDVDSLGLGVNVLPGIESADRGQVATG